MSNIIRLDSVFSTAAGVYERFVGTGSRMALCFRHSPSCILSVAGVTFDDATSISPYVPSPDYKIVFGSISLPNGVPCKFQKVISSTTYDYWAVFGTFGTSGAGSAAGISFPLTIEIDDGCTPTGYNLLDVYVETFQPSRPDCPNVTGSFGTLIAA